MNGAVVPLGVGLAVAPLVMGIVLVAAVTLGQWLARWATVVECVASLTARRASDYGPGIATWLVTGGVVVLGALLTWTSSLASADDMRRSGTVLAYSCELTERGQGGQVVSPTLATPSGTPSRARTTRSPSPWVS